MAALYIDPMIGVRTADCGPVAVYAPDLQAVAAIHAGWRGSIGGIVGKTMARLPDGCRQLYIIVRFQRTMMVTPQKDWAP